MAVGGSVAMPVFGLSSLGFAQDAATQPKPRVRVIPIYKAPEPLPEVLPPLPADPSDTGTVSGTQQFATAVSILPPPRPTELREAPSVVAAGPSTGAGPVALSSGRSAPATPAPAIAAAPPAVPASPAAVIAMVGVQPPASLSDPELRAPAIAPPTAKPIAAAAAPSPAPVQPVVAVPTLPAVPVIDVLPPSRVAELEQSAGLLMADSVGLPAPAALNDPALQPPVALAALPPERPADLGQPAPASIAAVLAMLGRPAPAVVADDALRAPKPALPAPEPAAGATTASLVAPSRASEQGFLAAAPKASANEPPVTIQFLPRRQSAADKALPSAPLAVATRADAPRAFEGRDAADRASADRTVAALVPPAPLAEPARVTAADPKPERTANVSRPAPAREEVAARAAPSPSREAEARSSRMQRSRTASVASDRVRSPAAAEQSGRRVRDRRRASRYAEFDDLPPPSRSARALRYEDLPPPPRGVRPRGVGEWVYPAAPTRRYVSYGPERRIARFRSDGLIGWLNSD
jgi:hypothetical protein